MKRTNKDNFIEWISATCSFGLSEGKNSLVEVQEHLKSDMPDIKIRRGILAYSSTICDNEHFIKKAIDCNSEIPGVFIKIDSIEGSYYCELIADNNIKFMFLKFIEETGFISSKIHIYKKVFESNGKVTMSVVIEESMTSEDLETKNE